MIMVIKKYTVNLNIDRYINLFLLFKINYSILHMISTKKSSMSSCVVEGMLDMTMITMLQKNTDWPCSTADIIRNLRTFKLPGSREK